jgi:plasmid maintenance system antidote protein VapI
VPEEREHVIEELRRAFTAARMRQADVCRYINLSQKHMTQIMRGHKPLSVAIAVRLEEAIPGIDAEYLMALQGREQVRKARAEQRTDRSASL